MDGQVEVVQLPGLAIMSEEGDRQDTAEQGDLQVGVAEEKGRAAAAGQPPQSLSVSSKKRKTRDWDKQVCQSVLCVGFAVYTLYVPN